MNKKTSDHTRAFHAIHKRQGGEVVIAKSTGKPLSKHPLSPAKAHAQLAAVEFHKHNPGKK